MPLQTPHKHSNTHTNTHKHTKCSVSKGMPSVVTAESALIFDNVLNKDSAHNSYWLYQYSAGTIRCTVSDHADFMFTEASSSSPNDLCLRVTPTKSLIEASQRDLGSTEQSRGSSLPAPGHTTIVHYGHQISASLQSAPITPPSFDHLEGHDGAPLSDQ